MKQVIALLLLSLSLNALAVNPALIRWHDQKADSALIESVLSYAIAETSSTDPQDYVAVIAARFLGTPYVGGTLESDDGSEALTIDLQRLDCTTFVESVMALALTAASGSRSWQDYATNLESLRYRSGRTDGYASRLHYISDWILDNSSRGNLTEVTASLPSPDYQIKTIDFMSSHSNLYPALSDPIQLAAVKSKEEGFRSHRFPYIRKARLLSDHALLNSLREGDIVALTTSTPGLDVSHMGIITMVGGKPHLLHASSKGGKVMVDPLTLGDYLRRNGKLTGIRVIRLR